MKVLFVSAEADPFAKVGGLADVVGSLPKALRRQGVDARVLMPGYRFINHDRYNVEFAYWFPLHRRTGLTDCYIYSTIHDEVPIYFLQGKPYFGEEDKVYGNWDTDVPRFIFFCQAALAAAEAMRDNEGWFPDVVHVHDWHTGLIPFLIDIARGESEDWRRVGTMMTIHNMAYQGDHAGGMMFEYGVHGRDHHWELNSRGLTDNMLAISMAYSDILTTVSPRYAIEIQYPYAGYGLDGLLRTRIPDLYGILNGIDMDLWNPATDRHLVMPYDVDSVAEKRILNKRALQVECGLPMRDDIPVIGMVSRLVWQKGLDLAIPALRQVLSEGSAQFVGLGSGEPIYDHEFWQLGADFGGRARTFVGFSASVAQRIYAGCDIFLMPSHYEPCGVGQMLAMRYGALPLVRETGGLADTVENYDDGDAERGTGFVFSWEDPDAATNTLRWAIRTYYERPAAWRRMQERAMRTDFSWAKSAREYVQLYDKAAARHQSS
jgi:starch synthase